MMTVLLVIVAIAAAGLAGWYLPRMIAAYARFRGRRLVKCPETGETVAVDPDAAHAAVSAGAGATELRLRDCTRWPEHRDCGQDCLKQVREHPEECLLHNIVKSWYAGKACAICHKPIDTSTFSLEKAALRDAGGETLEWREVRSERLPEVFASHQPLCWSCHIAAKFRRQHPDLVIDRPAY